MNITEFLDARISEDEDRAKSHYAAASTKGLGDYPLRVTAECAAKRKMLSNIPKSSDIFDPLGGTSAYVLFCLAAVYADHPDYLPEWKL